MSETTPALEALAIIPARGDSKRIPRKNLQVFRGRSILYHAVDVARRAGMFQEIVVNTDDDDIAEEAHLAGAKVYFRRPPYKGTDCFIIDLLRDMFEDRGEAPERSIGILLPTAPLRAVEDVQGAWKLFVEKGRKAPVVSMSEYRTPVHLGFVQSDEDHVTPLFPEDYDRSTKSTAHPPVYHYNEIVIFNTVAGLSAQKTMVGSSPIPYMTPPERTLLLDDALDMKVMHSLEDIEA